MISSLLSQVIRLDLGYLLTRVSTMAPVLVASREFTAESFGQFSSVYHQMLILSTIVIFGVHDRIAVESGADFSSELSNLLLRLTFLAPVALLYDEPTKPLLLLTSLVVMRSIPMLLFATSRSEGRRSVYMAVCLYVICSALVFCLGYLVNISVWTSLAVVLIVSLGLLGAVRLRVYPAVFRVSPSALVKDWDYAFNFILTSFYAQGILFFVSFVASPTEFAVTSKVMYLTQAGLLAQSVSYRSALSLLTDRSVSLRQILWFYSAVGAFCQVIFALFGPWLEVVLFGEHSLPRWSFVAVGFLVWLHTYNVALAPYMLSRGLVRKALAVPIVSAIVAALFLIAWPAIPEPNGIYLLMGAVSVAGLLTRAVVLNRAEFAST